eukprot:135091_1
MAAWSSGNLGIKQENYIFNLEDVSIDSWLTYINGTWTAEEGLMAQKCAANTTTAAPTIQPTPSPTPKCVEKTEFYGSGGGNVYDVWNQDKIIGISSWGSFNSSRYSFYIAIGNFVWISNTRNNAVNPAGHGPMSFYAPCTPFVLDDGDYIHGYRVIYGIYETFVTGLYFYTANGKLYDCIHPDVNAAEHKDSGIVLFERHYLSGFVFNSGWIIDGISLVFTAIDDDCTLEPTASPTASPTFSPISISYPSMLFGFETASETQSSLATNEYTVTITLYWDSSIFQCQVFPTDYATYYGCDTSNTRTTTQCDADAITPPVPHGIQFDNEGWDSVIINKVIIQHQHSEYSNNSVYQMVNFCGDPSCDGDAISDTLTVESMLVIVDVNDTSQPAMAEHIEWTKEYFDFQCNPMGHCIDAITTASYGSLTHSRRNIDINQGRINAITSWAIGADDNYPDYKGLANMKWSSDNQTSFNDNYGYATILDGCSNFTLDDDDYINQYRVVYNNYTIRGLTFKTKKKKLYHCMSNHLSDGQMDSGDIIYPDHYLSGFYVSSDSIIDSIAFQFTHINNTNICHNITNTSNPTMEPTAEPTFNPSVDPTRYPTRTPLSTDDIIIITHDDINTNWIAFNISNLNLSCGGVVHSVQITDAYLYENTWVNYSLHLNNYYEFNNLSDPFRVPISVQISKRDVDGDNEQIVTGLNVIHVFEGGRQLPFGDNFCGYSVAIHPQAVDWISSSDMPKLIMAGIAFVFIAIGGIALLDAKLIRKNDYFDIMAIVSSLFQILDMLSDVLFVMAVYATYRVANHNKFQFLLICALSIVFIVVPITISLYQLHTASSSQWIKDNRVVDWLNTYTKLLYFMSVFTGSSFSALEIFNCNMFRLDLFDMGLSQKHFMEFKTKKLYSIILFENTPQVILSVWYTILLGELDYIPAAQMLFSCISIVVTAIAVVLQKRIRDKQDSVYLSIDIQGQCVMDQLKICENRINKIKSYLAQSVLGVNVQSIAIQKPFGGSLVNGLRLHIHVVRVHDNSHRNLAHHYRRLLENAMRNGTLGAAIQDEWQLTSVPDIDVTLANSLQTKQESVVVTTDDETEALKHLHSGVLDNWHDITKYESEGREAGELDKETTTIEINRHESTQL